MNCNFLVTFIKSLKQSGIKPFLIGGEHVFSHEQRLNIPPKKNKSKKPPEVITNNSKLKFQLTLCPPFPHS